MPVYTSTINLAAVHQNDVLSLRRCVDVCMQGALNFCKTARKIRANKTIFTSSVVIANHIFSNSLIAELSGRQSYETYNLNS